ncbi:MAG TPA: GNAT family N-acetyltransferase [Terracidiphilus sp.]|nr:GNAT family N-acetyltransferase [Terracidiphilus sp.]
MLGAVRALTFEDVPSAMELSIAAHWNQTPEDWHRVIRLSPNGCFCIESEGKIAATATRVNYGKRLAWIGMVLTRQENRRQGYARRLMEHAITSADNRTLKLDATEPGRPLYASLGFVVENTIERWERRGDADAGAAAASGCRVSEELLAHDAKAFGVSRKELLRDLSTSANCQVISDGYVMSRRGRMARYLGPCVAASPKNARDLIARHLNGYAAGCAWYWDLLPTNADAVSCAQDLGFTRSRMLWRMRYGDPIENDDSSTYAIAGFELG